MQKQLRVETLDRVYTGCCRPMWLSTFVWACFLFAIAHDSLHKVQTFTSVPARFETQRPRDSVLYSSLRRLGCVIAACMYPGTIAGCALPLAHGGFAHDEILSSCRRGTCSVVTFSSGLPRRLRSCALAWAGMGWDVVHAEGKHDGFLGGACLLMGRARACGVDRRLARFLFGHSLTLNDRRDTS